MSFCLLLLETGGRSFPKTFDRLRSIFVLLFIIVCLPLLFAFRRFPMAIEKGVGSTHIHGVDEVPH